MKRPMEKKDAEFLADTVIQQLLEIPLAIPKEERIVLPKDKLVEIILSAKASEDSERMQFEIPLCKYNKNGGLIIDSFHPRRIITSYDTDYETNPGFVAWLLMPLVLKDRKKKEEEYDLGKSWDPEVICRRLREDPETAEVRIQVLAKGAYWGLMADYSTKLICKDGGEKPGPPVLVPLFFFPHATKQEMDVLARFSIKNQRPKHQEHSDYVVHDIFEDRLYK